MPIKYIPYVPNTIEGQAILDNITRTQRILRYRENDKVYQKIQRGMPYYEVEPIETVGDTTTENIIMRGECLSACAYLKDKGIKVDLVYIDPPFASGADYAKKVYIRRNPKLAEKIAAAEQEMDIEELKAFEETMYGDIWQKEDYLNWMYENLMAIKSIMSDTASIYVHLDWHIGHYVKILMDEVFGEDNFRNEIIWRRTLAGKTVGKSLPSNTDTIFWYSKNDEYCYNTITRKFTEKDKEEFKKDDDDGRGKYTTVSLQKVANPTPGTLYDYIDNNGKIWKCPSKGWRMVNEKLKSLENSNRLYISENTIREKYYLAERIQIGKQIDNLWHDIGNMNRNKSEDVDYPTQKPSDLLNRIISMCSNEGMIVADFFGGSGVTAKVAHDLGRKFIHCDIGINSIQTARDRLKEAGASFNIMEIQDGVSLFRNPQQTMDKLATLITGLVKNVAGLNSFWFGAITESQNGTVPVYVPDLINSQQKLLDIPLINTIINQELHNFEIDVKKVIVYYIDIEDYAEINKFIRDNNMANIQVELRDLKNLLHDIVIEDIIDYKLETTDTNFSLEITNFISDRLIQKISTFNDKAQLQATKGKKDYAPITISDNGLELIELIALDCQNTTGQWHSSNEIKIDKKGYMIIDGNKTKQFWDGRITTTQKPLRLKVRNICGDETILNIES